MELEAGLERVALQPSREEEHSQTVDTASQSNTERDHFRHTPLPGDRYIRLLRIVEGDAECISITLHTFPLEQLPDYDALSYTWGKAISADGDDDNNGPDIYYEILINTEPFSITENLYDGLAELRKEVMGYLWVDALCIDQTNIDEQASQVPLMGDIYSSASCVIIWLGEAIYE
ncbi:HET-domain-containing protein, partial [Hyaloscypha variabilis F]